MILQQRLYILVLIVSLAVLTAPAACQAQSHLRILPADTVMYVSDVFEIDVYIDSFVVNLMGWDITVGYDEAILDLVDVLEGSLPEDSGYPTTFFWLNKGADDGTVHVNGSVLGKTVDSPGVLLTLIFEAVEIGACDICITDSELRNNLNRPIAHTTHCGHLMIEIPIAAGQSSWGTIKKAGGN